jgi:catechol 2,3-dioxygenase-like lactoylglutathione lyase family enzyme
MNMRLEVVNLPVSDVDRAKAFYAGLGWRLDADFASGEAFRVVQFTPPGSDCSIQFGRGRTTAAPGSAQGLFLVVADIEEAHKALAAHGAGVSDIFHARPGEAPKPGPDPERRSYASFVKFSDPDGNSWLVQEITKRLPGRGGPELTMETHASS